MNGSGQWVRSQLIFAIAAIKSGGTMDLIHEDVDRFWEIWQTLPISDLDACAKVLEEEYLNKGTAGLRDFWRLRIESGRQFADTIRAFPRYYASLQATCVNLSTQEDSIRDACSRLNDLVGQSPRTDSYFLIGCMNSAGTVSESGLLIGLDMMGRSESAPLDELGDWHRSVVRPLDELPRLVLHEYVHALQETSTPKTLLANSILEGTADFVVSLLLGRHETPHHQYGRIHEADLWVEFKDEMGGSDIDNWLCQGDSATDRPADLGYFLGHQICAAYYARQSDPQTAVRQMLCIESFEDFASDSGYDGEAPVANSK